MEIYSHNELVRQPLPPEKRPKPPVAVIALLSATVALLLVAVALLSAVLVAVKKAPTAPPDLRALTARLLPQVTQVRCGALTGSGVVWQVRDDDVLVLTNRHVIASYADMVEREDASAGEETYQPRVRFCGTNDFLTAEALGWDTYHDVALLRVTGRFAGVTAVATDDGYTVAAGQTVLAIGNNLGNGVAVFDGIVSQTSRLLSPTGLDKTVPVYQITAPVNAGMSGGGLFDATGLWIGLNTYQSNYVTDGGQRPVDGVSYSVPACIVLPLARQLLADYDGSPLTQVRQVSVFARTDTAEIDFFDLYFRAAYEAEGLTVTHLGYVTKPVSMSADLKVGDVIVGIGDAEIDGGSGYVLPFAECLLFLPDASAKGRTLRVRVLRDGTPVTVEYYNIHRK